MIDDLELAATPPQIDVDSAAFWSALAEGHLLIHRCDDCLGFSFPPIASCPLCASVHVRDALASGDGTIYSWVTVHVALDPRFARDVPYTIVAVRLAAGPRMLGRFIDDAESPSAGAAVTLVPYRSGEIILPGFRLSTPGAQRSEMEEHRA
jgi:uncharacterized protein